MTIAGTRPAEGQREAVRVCERCGGGESAREDAPRRLAHSRCSERWPPPPAFCSPCPLQLRFFRVPGWADPAQGPHPGTCQRGAGPLPSPVPTPLGCSLSAAPRRSGPQGSPERSIIRTPAWIRGPTTPPSLGHVRPTAPAAALCRPRYADAGRGSQCPRRPAPAAARAPARFPRPPPQAPPGSFRSSAAAGRVGSRPRLRVRASSPARRGGVGPVVPGRRRGRDGKRKRGLGGPL